MTDPFPRLSARVSSEPIDVTPPNQPPIAEFSWTDVSGTGGNPAHTVQITDISTDTDGVIVGRTIDWGDVAAPTPPTASFTFIPNVLTVAFTSTSIAAPGRSINQRSWTFGDGGVSSAQNPSHTYPSSGAYPVSLTVTDDLGTVSAPYQQTVTVSSGSSTVTGGRPFGPNAGWNGSSPQPNSDPFNLVSGASTPNNIVAQINYCKAHNKTMKIIMAGGLHSQYIDQATGNFSLQLWKNKIDTFDDPTKTGSNGRTAIRAAIASGVASGNIMGHDMMDEPGNSTPTKGWGPVMTRALLDTMADYSKSKWPTMPAGCWMPHDDPLPGDPAVFQSVDFTVDAFVWRKIGWTTTLAAWINEAKAYFDAQGLAYVFAINPINGGYKPAMWDDAVHNPQYPSPYPNIDNCPIPPTGGIGTSEHIPPDLCAMTASQYQTYGIQLINAADALCIWRWDTEYMARTETISAENAIRAVADTLTRPRWTRRF